MTMESQPATQNTTKGIVDNMMRLFEQIEKTSEKGAATILFIVGISLFVVTYGIKFFTIPLSKDMTSSEFDSSIIVALVLILFAAATRLFLFYVAVNESRRVGKELIELEDKTNARRVDSAKLASDKKNEMLDGVRYAMIVPHILNTPNLVSGIGAFSAAEKHSASTRRVSAGVMMPSSHSRAVA